MAVTAQELMLGMGVSTTVWGLFMPSVSGVKDMELGELRAHEIMAATGILAMGVVISVVSHDSSVFGVTVTAICVLGALYEWAVWRKVV